MNDVNSYYMIKIEDVGNGCKTWLGWSNSNSSDGFYLTSEKQCKVFSDIVLNEDINIKLYLQNKQYKLVPVIDFNCIKGSRIYF